MTYIQLPNGAIVDANILIWLIPLALFILILFQFLYITFLRYAPTRREAPPPAQPIMPAVYAPVSPQVQQQPVIMQPQAPVQQPMMQQPVISQPPVQQPPVIQAQPRALPPAPVPAAPRGTAMTMGKFIILSGLDSPKEIALPGANFFIGRFYSPENNVLVGLDEKSISRKHSQFIGDDGLHEYYLKDSNSSFGTYLLINGNFEQLNPDRQERVYNEDVVQFGNLVTVRLLLPCEARAPITNL